MKKFKTLMRQSIESQIYLYKRNGRELHHSGMTFQEIIDQFIFYYDIDVDNTSLYYRYVIWFQEFHQQRVNRKDTILVSLTKQQHREIHKKIKW